MPAASNTHSWIASACTEKTAKFTPVESACAPIGQGLPSVIVKAGAASDALRASLWPSIQAFHSNITVARGGRSTTIECGLPWKGNACAIAAPSGVPMLLPP